MKVFNKLSMQSALTLFGLGPLSFWEWLPLLGGLTLVALAVIAGLPGRRRPVNPRVVSQLLHRVHDRREQLFVQQLLRHPARAWPGATRERFLALVRERLRACEFLHRDSSQPVCAPASGFEAKH